MMMMMMVYFKMHRSGACWNCITRTLVVLENWQTLLFYVCAVVCS